MNSILQRIPLVRNAYPQSWRQLSTFSTNTAKYNTADVTVIGGGMAGLASIHRLRTDGFSINAIEEGSDVGGTWYWNRYPGSYCDVEAMSYSAELDPEVEQTWNWPEVFASQRDILRYIEHLADKHQLRDHIHFNQRVIKCEFCEIDKQWTVTTDKGDRFTSRMLILGTGALSATNKPPLPGLGDFQGDVYCSSDWPKEPVDFTGKRVAVIGTGSSGVQCIPKIAEMAQYVTVYQRSPQYIVPLGNRKLEPSVSQKIKDDYATFRQLNKESGFGFDIEQSEKMFDEMSEDEFQREMWRRLELGRFRLLGICKDFTSNPRADLLMANFIRERMRERVRDPKISERLCPSVYQLYACKRPLYDTNYLETFNKENVELVSVSADCGPGNRYPDKEPGTPITFVSRTGICTSDGVERKCDVLVFATGFDAMTGSFLRMDIRGRDGVTLQQSWKDGPQTYLGLQTCGFPNMFNIRGPQSPSVMANGWPSIEQQVHWIGDLLVNMRENQYLTVEPTENAQQDWVRLNDEVASDSHFKSAACFCWYHGSNIENKQRNFSPSLMGFGEYTKRCNEVANKNYDGFIFNTSVH